MYIRYQSNACIILGVDLIDIWFFNRRIQIKI